MPRRVGPACDCGRHQRRSSFQPRAQSNSGYGLHQTKTLKEAVTGQIGACSGDFAQAGT